MGSASVSYWAEPFKRLLQRTYAIESNALQRYLAHELRNLDTLLLLLPLRGTVEQGLHALGRIHGHCCGGADREP